MRIRFLGGVRTVTGTCFHIIINNLQILVDCGMFQGEDADKINKNRFAFQADGIDYLFLTHAHIDHSGLIPKLIKEGFKGRIISTSATAELSQIMLYDSAHIQEKDAEWMTKKSFRSGRDIVYSPLYTIEDVKAAIPFFDGKPYGKLEHLGQGVSYRFVDAGHIIGSATLEIIYQDSPSKKTIVFSGDIGKKGNPIINDPEYINTADYIVIESTYGNRLHKNIKDTLDEFIEAIKITFKKGGNVLIPAFAVGRTQDILYTLNKIVREGRLPTLNVYVDSPLAEEATKVYLSHPECFDAETRSILSDKKSPAIKVHFTKSVEESQRLNSLKSGAIIIAGSGMCEGGRIRHHFKHNLWRPECSIIFTGFQARGTLGRKIIDGLKVVNLLGEEIAVKARVYTIGGFSAHADQKELLEWLGAFSNKPEVFVVHGEENVSIEFASAVKGTFGYKTHVPYRGEEFDL